MLVLFETPAGYALFKVLDEGKLIESSDVHKCFENAETAGSTLKLVNFQKFKDTTEALAAASALVDGSMDDGLKKFLKKSIVKVNLKDQLAVADSKLAGLIKEELNIKCVNNSSVHELMRGIRRQMNTLLESVSSKDLHAMALGLSHSLGRYKLKFSADKVDTMVIQAIALLDELDKEINIYAMRVKEWFGWHFPEMGKIVVDNVQYAKVVLKMGIRKLAANMDFSDILEENIEEEMKKVALVSTGTEVSDQDLTNIQELATQVLDLSVYRAQLFDYLQQRMRAIAPNLSVIVGELVGARLLAHAGSLINLAKFPASTVQILGAEKALFRALKTRHETPKYGLIYHATLVGQASIKHKGKISRALAAKAVLGIRVDAFGDKPDAQLGIEAREKIESRLRELEGGAMKAAGGANRSRQKVVASTPSASSRVSFSAASDVVGLETKIKTPVMEVVSQKAPEKDKEKAVDEKAEKKRLKEEKKQKKELKKQKKLEKEQSSVDKKNKKEKKDKKAKKKD